MAFRNISSRRLSTIVLRESSWKIPETRKPIFHGRTVIVSAADEVSKELSKRMWFELQKNGIQSSFITVNTPFPTISNLQESVGLFRRTASKSIITIGNETITDYGKLMRQSIETGMNISQLTKQIDSTKLRYLENIPLISLTSTPAINHVSPIYRYLHVEDDILVPGQGKSPDIISTDPALTVLSPYITPQLMKGYMVASLFDICFTLSFLTTSIQHPALLSTIQTLLSKTNHSLASTVFQSNDTNSFNFWDNTSDVHQTIEAISQLKSLILEDTQVRVDCWPGMIEIITNLGIVNPAAEYNYPTAYMTVKVFHALLHKILTQRDEYYTKVDEQILLSVEKALELVHAILFVPPGGESQFPEQYTPMIAKIMEDALQSQQLHVKKFARRHVAKAASAQQVETLPAGGHLEKLLIPLDMEQEDLGSLNVGGVVQKDLLKSDIMVDLMGHALAA